MISITLNRIIYTKDETRGVVYSGDTIIGLTLENPWQSNKPFISCIPRGLYRCFRYSSDKYPNTWRIAGVPDRTSILFHSGNTADDVAGCILIGETFGSLHSKNAVLNSRKAINHFMDFTNYAESLFLKITGEY